MSVSKTADEGSIPSTPAIYITLKNKKNICPDSESRYKEVAKTTKLFLGNALV